MPAQILFHTEHPDLGSQEMTNEVGDRGADPNRCRCGARTRLQTNGRRVADISVVRWRHFPETAHTRTLPH